MSYFSETWFDLVITVSLATIFIVVLTKLKRRGQKYNFPTGPSGVPILGNILSFVTDPLPLKLSEWAYKFGNIYKIQLGPRPAVVVNDLATMKEIFSIYPASTGKLLTDLFKLPFGGKYGLLCVDGKHWQEQRQFCIKNLRNLGLGKGATMEPMIVDEANELVAWLRKQGANDRPVQVLGELQKATINALWGLVTGDKIPPGDTRFADVIQDLVAAVQIATKTGLVFLPWLKHLAPEKSGYNFLYKTATSVNQFVRENIEQHQTSFQVGSPTDLIDAFLEQMKREKDSRSSFYGEEGWKHFVGTIVTLFLGGGESTATTLTWMIFYLSCDQQIQRKLQEEIDREIGLDREASLKDKLNMPYTEAVILETLRKSSFLPMGLIHELTEDIHFRKIWGDPEKFRPERFLSGDKSLREHVVGFQVGKRTCLGEGLAKDILFLFATKLFQKFHFTLDPSHEEKEYLEPDIGFALATKHLPIVASCREGFRD